MKGIWLAEDLGGIKEVLRFERDSFCMSSSSTRETGALMAFDFNDPSLSR